ncbi:MAG TPA: SGNH/GDSL hydrolase family protein [Tepidisphaeraceae bacterium]|nr:SGNH/GDSL hydrolase family protein [Tepidisphaeraceae bacterium]
MPTLPTVHPRTGLGRVGRKLASGQQAVVAWLGGSITWGSAASEPDRTSYRALVTNWLRGVFRAELVWEVNAAIGGTGSELAAFRLGSDVLAKDADVVFVEFAVNDDGTADDTVVAAMEGIVRACRSHPAPPELCFVYTLRRNWVGPLVAGELPRPIALHERVAARYGVASVNVALDLARAVAAGDVAWDAAMNDDVHPRDAGFKRYAETLRTALTDLLSAEPAPTAPLPPPLSVMPLDRADMTSVAMLPNAFAGWSLRPMKNRGGWDCFDALLESNTPGATAAFSFTGRAVGLLYQLGPDTGDFAFAIDAGPFQTVRPFDAYAPTFWRPHYRLLAIDLAPGPRTVTVRVEPTKDERSRGTWTKLGYLLTAE